MTLLNDEYFANLQSTINAISTCADLQKIITQLENEITAEIQAILNNIGMLKMLLINPLNLNSVIQWISNFIKIIEGPYLKIIQEEIKLIQRYEQLLVSLANINLNLHCNLTLPSAPSLPSIPSSTSPGSSTSITIKGGLS